MRQRLLAWGTAASMVAGLAAAATTLRIDGRTAGKLLLSWIDNGGSAAIVGDPGGGIGPDGGAGAADPDPAGDTAGGGNAPDDRIIRTTLTEITPYALDDLSSLADARGTPDAASPPDGPAPGEPATTAPGSTDGMAGSPDGDTTDRENVIMPADGTTPGDGTTPVVVEPEIVGAGLNDGAAALPFLNGEGNAASSGGSSSGGLIGGGASGGGLSSGGSSGGGSSGGGSSGGGSSGGGSSGGGSSGGGSSGGGSSGGATVPEPATWLLMIAGFGLTGVATRRRAGRPGYSGAPANSASR